MKRRSRIDIAAAILSLGQAGATFTRIMNAVGLSSINARKYVMRMENSGLLKRDSSDKKYFVSAKGRMFLEIYAQMTEQEFVLGIIRAKENKAPIVEPISA